VIRFAWRQFRVQAAVAAGALVVIAVVLAITGSHLVHVYDTSVATCKANRGSSAVCVNAVTNTYRFLQDALPVLVIVVPALIGIFWGAPLVARELETGSCRLAWTQSVSRSRWLFVKLGVVGVSSMVAAGLLALMVTGWSSPIEKVSPNRFSPSLFSVLGIAPIGYAAFAFAFGVTAGLLIRRTLPAMAATLLAFVGARLAVTYWVRPHLMSPVKTVMALKQSYGTGISQSSTGTGLTFLPPSVNIPNAWIYSNEVVNRSGHAPTTQFLQSACRAVLSGSAAPVNHPVRNPNSGFPECFGRVAAKFHEVLTYQPASRYWAFQWYETTIFVGAALVLAGLCFWWLRHRVT
jgi:ABC-type transport system involved in multi-copper enzyme maturation permease subunit